MISESYPYLSIAKKHRIPYELVLHMAEQFRGLGASKYFQLGDMRAMADPKDVPMYDDFEYAMSHFDGIRAGVLPFPGG